MIGLEQLTKRIVGIHDPTDSFSIGKKKKKTKICGEGREYIPEIQ